MLVYIVSLPSHLTLCERHVTITCHQRLICVSISECTCLISDHMQDGRASAEDDLPAAPGSGRGRLLAVTSRTRHRDTGQLTVVHRPSTTSGKVPCPASLTVGLLHHMYMWDNVRTRDGVIVLVYSYSYSSTSTF